MQSEMPESDINKFQYFLSDLKLHGSPFINENK